MEMPGTDALQTLRDMSRGPAVWGGANHSNPYAALEQAFIKRIAALRGGAPDDRTTEQADAGPGDVWLASRMAATAPGNGPPHHDIADELLHALIAAQIEAQLHGTPTAFQRAQMEGAARREDLAERRADTELALAKRKADRQDELESLQIEQAKDPLGYIAKQDAARLAYATGIGLPPDSAAAHEKQTQFALSNEAEGRYFGMAESAIRALGPDFNAAKFEPQLSQILNRIDRELPAADPDARQSLKATIRDALAVQLQKNTQANAPGNAPRQSHAQLYRLMRDPAGATSSQAVPVDPSNANPARQGSAGLVWATPEEADRFARNDRPDVPDPLVERATKEPSQGPTIALGFLSSKPGDIVLSGGQPQSVGGSGLPMDQSPSDEQLGAVRAALRKLALSPNPSPDDLQRLKKAGLAYGQDPYAAYPPHNAAPPAPPPPFYQNPHPEYGSIPWNPNNW